MKKKKKKRVCVRKKRKEKNLILSIGNYSATYCTALPSPSPPPKV